jgi:DNA-directed RNA polymerase specialized sigma24 family protein
MNEGSVTCWLRLIIKAEERAACQHLWQRYFQRLVGLARVNLRWTSRRAADEEDVALSVLANFFQGAGQGRFPLLSDRHDLWSLLVVITRRKAANLARHQNAARRGGKVRRVSAPPAAAAEEGPLFAALIGKEPDPAFAAEVAEECRRLLSRLGDATLRSVALWKMEGYTNQEIAAELKLAVPTVERKLARIRATWAKEGPAPEAPGQGKTQENVRL